MVHWADPVLLFDWTVKWQQTETDISAKLINSLRHFPTIYRANFTTPNSPVNGHQQRPSQLKSLHRNNHRRTTDFHRRIQSPRSPHIQNTNQPPPDHPPIRLILHPIPNSPIPSNLPVLLSPPHAIVVSLQFPSLHWRQTRHHSPQQLIP